MRRLVTAKEWERAAIVWAWTREGVNQYESLVSSYQAMTITDFAKLGIINLSSRNSVREYRQRWQSIIDELGDAAFYLDLTSSHIVRWCVDGRTSSLHKVLV